jgi:putative oxidoreductase
VGLLLLRLTLAGALISDGITRLREPAIGQMIFAVSEHLVGALLAVGLWASLSAVVVSLLQFGTLSAAGSAIELHLLVGFIGLAVTFLGPGAWALDSRLYGRRRVEIKNIREG